MENENYSLQADEEKKYMSLVTDIGNAAMMKAVSKGEKIEIKEFAVGDGGGMPYIPDTKMTALKNEVWRGQINYCKISEESENVLIINAIISGEVGGFTIREMGVFDTQNRMIAICNTPETPKVRIIDGVVNEMNLLMEIVLVNNAAVELKIDHNIVTATKQEVRDLRDELNERFDNIHETTVSFEESEKRENINSGDKLKVIFGKIKKIISDLKQVAFTGSYNDLKDKPVINMNTINGTLGIEKGGTGATTAQDARANLGLGTAATCAVANNDVTNNTTHLVTAAVAYQHGKEIDKLNSDLTEGLNGCKITYEGGEFYGICGDVKKKFSPAKYIGSTRNSMAGSGILICQINVPKGTHIVICSRFDHYLPPNYTFALTGYHAISLLHQHVDAEGYGKYVYYVYKVTMNSAGKLSLSGSMAQNENVVRSQEMSVIQIE